MQQAIEHPSVWTGDELLSRPDWLYTLDQQDIDEVEALASHQCEDLPRMDTLLRQVQCDLENGSGAVMIRGFPVRQMEEEACKRLFIGLGTVVGTPISQSADGDLIFSVRDEGFGEDDPRTRGPNTNKKLSFHTDRCDVIAFLCLKQAKSGGENQVVSSPALYNAVRDRRPDLLKVLMSPFYYKRHNVDQGNHSPYCQQPIFSFCHGVFAANILRVLIERAHADPSIPDLSDLQIEALDYLENLSDDPAFHVTFSQQPGDMLFLNNWVTFHRRTAFEDHDDIAERRHLLRLWLSVPNSRELDPLFVGNYGATGAGMIRGGMRKR